MLVKFKASVTYKRFLLDNCVRSEAAFLGHSSIFCRTLSDANMVFCVTGKMLGFPHEFLIKWENAANLPYDKNLGYQYLYFFQATCLSVPSNFHYGTLHFVDGICVFTQISRGMPTSMKRPYHMGRILNTYTHIFIKIGLFFFHQTPVP